MNGYIIYEEQFLVNRASVNKFKGLLNLVFTEH